MLSLSLSLPDSFSLSRQLLKNNVTGIIVLVSVATTSAASVPLRSDALFAFFVRVKGGFLRIILSPNNQNTCDLLSSGQVYEENTKQSRSKCSDTAQASLQRCAGCANLGSFLVLMVCGVSANQTEWICMWLFCILEGSNAAIDGCPSSRVRAAPPTNLGGGGGEGNS